MASRTIPFVRTICLLAAAAATSAGCAPPLYKTHPELPARKNGIRAAGLLPPAIAVSQEQFNRRLVPMEDWSRQAAETFARVFVEEMAAAGSTVKAIGGGEAELNGMADLFGAVDYSIRRHVYGEFEETFPRKSRFFDYSLGAAREAMERRGADAIWIVTGHNYLPTAGETLLDAFELLVAIAGGAGGAPVSTSILMKVELRAALVDRDGTVLFYCRLTEPDILKFGWEPGWSGAPSAADGSSRAADDLSAGEDVRDPVFARRCARALVAEYRKAAR